eukprot:SAG31_NODE_17_length_35773_cov_25.999271_38_plen_71_part_00
MQVWIDTPATLGIKYAALKAKGLKGVGMWTAGSVDYDNPDGQAREMWDELKVFAPSQSVGGPVRRQLRPA